MSGCKIILGSRSPRRRQLLEEAGWTVQVTGPHIDDGQLDPPADHAPGWTMALAWMKARSVSMTLDAQMALPIVTADTVCVHDGHVIGQPTDARHARSMVVLMRDATHDVLTGLCVLYQGQRHLAVDRSTVHVGTVSDTQVDQYIQSNAWQGKAGAYNLSDRVEAGWPIRWEGDPTTIMGLPMNKLMPLLRDCGVECPS